MELRKLKSVFIAQMVAYQEFTADRAAGRVGTFAQVERSELQKLTERRAQEQLIGVVKRDIEKEQSSSLWRAIVYGPQDLYNALSATATSVMDSVTAQARAFAMDSEKDAQLNQLAIDLGNALNAASSEEVFITVLMDYLQRLKVIRGANPAFGMFEKAFQSGLVSILNETDSESPLHVKLKNFSYYFAMTQDQHRPNSVRFDDPSTFNLAFVQTFFENLTVVDKGKKCFYSFEDKRYAKISQRLLYAKNEADFAKALDDLVVQSSNDSRTAWFSFRTTKIEDYVVTALQACRSVDPAFVARLLRQPALSTVNAKMEQLTAPVLVVPQPIPLPRVVVEEPMSSYRLTPLSDKSAKLIESESAIDFNDGLVGYNTYLATPFHLLAMVRELKEAQQVFSASKADISVGELAPIAKLLGRSAKLEKMNKARLYCADLMDGAFVGIVINNAQNAILNAYFSEALVAFNSTPKTSSSFGAVFGASKAQQMLDNEYRLLYRWQQCQLLSRGTFSPEVLDESVRAFIEEESVATRLTLLGTKISAPMIKAETKKQTEIRDEIAKKIGLIHEITADAVQSSPLPLASYNAEDLEMIAGAFVFLDMVSQEERAIALLPRDIHRLNDEFIIHGAALATAFLEKITFMVDATNALQRNFDAAKALVNPHNGLSSLLPMLPAYELIFVDSDAELTEILPKKTYLSKDPLSLYQSDALGVLHRVEGIDKVIEDIKDSDVASLTQEQKKSLNDALLKSGCHSIFPVSLSSLLTDIDSLQEQPQDFFRDNSSASNFYANLEIPRCSLSMGIYFILQYGPLKSDALGHLLTVPGTLVYNENRLLLPENINKKVAALLVGCSAIKLQERLSILRKFSALFVTIQQLKNTNDYQNADVIKLICALPAIITALKAELRATSENIVSADLKMNALVESIEVEIEEVVREFVAGMVRDNGGVDRIAPQAQLDISRPLAQANEFIGLYGDIDLKKNYLTKAIDEILTAAISFDEKITLIERLTGVLKLSLAADEDLVQEVIAQFSHKFSTHEPIDSRFLTFFSGLLNGLAAQEDKIHYFNSCVAKIMGTNYLPIMAQIELIYKLSQSLAVPIDAVGKKVLIASILEKYEAGEVFDSVFLKELYSLIESVDDVEIRQSYIDRYKEIIAQSFTEMLAGTNSDADKNAAIVVDFLSDINRVNAAITDFNYSLASVFDEYLRQYENGADIAARIMGRSDRAFSVNFNRAYTGLVSRVMLGNLNSTFITAEQKKYYVERINKISYALLSAYVEALKNDEPIDYDENSFGEKIKFLLDGTVYPDCTRQTFIEDQIALHISQGDFEGTKRLIQHGDFNEDLKDKLICVTTLFGGVPLTKITEAKVREVLKDLTDSVFLNLFMASLQTPGSITAQKIRTIRGLDNRGCGLIDRVDIAVDQVTQESVEKKSMDYSAAVNVLNDTLFYDFIVTLTAGLSVYQREHLNSKRIPVVDLLFMEISKVKKPITRAAIETLKSFIVAQKNAIEKEYAAVSWFVNASTGGFGGKGSELFRILTIAITQLEGLESALVPIEKKREELHLASLKLSFNNFLAIDFHKETDKHRYLSIVDKYDDFDSKTQAAILAKCDTLLTEFVSNLDAGVSIENIREVLNLLISLNDPRRHDIIDKFIESLGLILVRLGPSIDASIQHVFLELPNPIVIANVRMFVALQKIHQALSLNSAVKIPELGDINSPADFSLETVKRRYLEQVLSGKTDEESDLRFKETLAEFSDLSSEAILVTEPVELAARHVDEDQEAENPLEGANDFAVDLWISITPSSLERRYAFKLVDFLQENNSDNFYTLVIQNIQKSMAESAVVTKDYLTEKVVFLTAMSADAGRYLPDELTVLTKCIEQLPGADLGEGLRLERQALNLLSSALTDPSSREQRAELLQEVFCLLNALLLLHAIGNELVAKIAIIINRYQAQFETIIDFKPKLKAAMMPIIKSRTLIRADSANYEPIQRLAQMFEDTFKHLRDAKAFTRSGVHLATFKSACVQASNQLYGVSGRSDFDNKVIASCTTLLEALYLELQLAPLNRTLLPARIAELVNLKMSLAVDRACSVSTRDNDLPNILSTMIAKIKQAAKDYDATIPVEQAAPNFDQLVHLAYAKAEIVQGAAAEPHHPSQVMLAAKDSVIADLKQALTPVVEYKISGFFNKARKQHCIDNFKAVVTSAIESLEKEPNNGEILSDLIEHLQAIKGEFSAIDSGSSLVSSFQRVIDAITAINVAYLAVIERYNQSVVASEIAGSVIRVRPRSDDPLVGDDLGATVDLSRATSNASFFAQKSADVIVVGNGASLVVSNGLANSTDMDLLVHADKVVDLTTTGFGAIPVGGMVRVLSSFKQGYDLGDGRPGASLDMKEGLGDLVSVSRGSSVDGAHRVMHTLASLFDVAPFIQKVAGVCIVYASGAVLPYLLEAFRVFRMAHV